MAKNRWYSKKEDAYLRRRIRQLRVADLPYGRRSAIYREIAHEMQTRFGIRRTGQGVQQRARIIEDKEEPHEQDS